MTKFAIPGTALMLDAEPFIGAEVTITPEDAKQMLEHGNPDNRNISVAVVAKYARDMLAGNWEHNTNIITVNDAGMIMDGHHRLGAIVKAGIPVRARVVVVPEATKNLFDIGRNRSLNDITGISSVILAALRIMDALVKKQSKGKSSMSAMELEQLYHEYERSIDVAKGITGIRNHKGSAFAGSFLCAVIAAVECGVDVDELKSFFNVYKNGVSTNDREAIVIYAKLSVEIAANKYGSKDSQTMRNVKCKVIQQGIFDYVNNNTRKMAYRVDQCKGVYTDKIAVIKAMKGAM